MPDAPIPNRTVALYSGGIDSFCMAALLEPDVLLSFNLGGRYGHEEQWRLQAPPGLEDRIEYADLDLGQWELPENFIIPARNAILVLAAVNYGSTIYLGSVAKSRGADKDETFRDRLNHLMEHLFSPQDIWIPLGRNVKVELPVYHLTKTQLVANTLEAGVPGEAIRDRTFSCYTPRPDGQECGNCKPCGRKWAALAANGIPPVVDARGAFQPYYDEVLTGDPNNRGPVYLEEVMRAWHSPF